MSSSPSPTLSGSCLCTHVRYTLLSLPLIVHACHCTQCQRETGSAFALNAVIEHDRISTTLSTGEEAEPQLMQTSVPTEQGGAVTTRCPRCYCVLWSVYAADGDLLRVVRVGTLDSFVDEAEGKRVPCGGLRPAVHIYTRTMVGGIDLTGEKVYEGPGKREEFWSKESLERRDVLMKKAGR
jgi:hypothetical protein